MNFKRARSKEQKDIRIDQIIDATLKLSETIPFEKITLATIAKELDFTRANLYKYVKSKEEILLEIIVRDEKAWIEDIYNSFDLNVSYSIDAFADRWAKTLYKHERFIKLISILFSIIEKNVSLDKLVIFKKSIFKELVVVHKIIKHLVPVLSDEQINRFLGMQFYYVIGLYSVINETELQRKAIKKSGIPLQTPDFVEQLKTFIVFTIRGLSET